jgi:hypothetical protein
MDMQDVLNKVGEWKASQTAIQERRAYWTSNTRQLLLDTLNNIRKESKLDMQVQDVNAGANQQAVNIRFNHSSSGMQYKDGNSSGVKTKYGGALIFTQAYNGDIFVIITFPSVEDHVSELPSKLVERIAPQKIDGSCIMKHFVGFLDIMTKWEMSDTPSKKIGFKVGEQTSETAEQAN